MTAPNLPGLCVVHPADADVVHRLVERGDTAPHGGDAPRLRVDCACVTEVTFGTTRIGAAQDWVFTMEQGPTGWRLADVDGVIAHVNWHPAPPA